MYEHNKPPLSDNDPPPAYTVFPSNVQSGKSLCFLIIKICFNFSFKLKLLINFVFYSSN